MPMKSSSQHMHVVIALIIQLQPSYKSCKYMSMYTRVVAQGTASTNLTEILHPNQFPRLRLPELAGQGPPQRKHRHASPVDVRVGVLDDRRAAADRVGSGILARGTSLSRQGDLVWRGDGEQPGGVIDVPVVLFREGRYRRLFYLHRRGNHRYP